MNTTKLITVAIAAALIAGAPAKAEDVPTVNVPTNGVNLLDPTQVKAMESRIKTAAIKVCQTPEQSAQGPLSYSRPCFVKARDNALAGLRQQIAMAQSRKGGQALASASSAQK